MSEKIVYLMRGVSGSGKSYKVAQLLQGNFGRVVSADHFWLRTGNYVFDGALISEAHSWCYGQFIEALRFGVTPIVVDNTNITAYEMRRYVVSAQKYGYKVEIVESDTPWRFDVAELAKHNQHGVPENKLQSMVDRYEHDVTIETILASQPPWEKPKVDKESQEKTKDSL